MIEKKTILDKIEVNRDGSIGLRFALLLCEDGAEIDSKWHRTVVEPGGDVDAQIAAVDQHLRSMGRAPVEKAVDMAAVKAIKAIVQTPDVVQAYKERIESADSINASARIR